MNSHKTYTFKDYEIDEFAFKDGTTYLIVVDIELKTFYDAHYGADIDGHRGVPATELVEAVITPTYIALIDDDGERIQVASLSEERMNELYDWLDNQWEKLIEIEED